MPLTGEESEVAEDGPYGGGGADAVSVGPTLRRRVVK